MPNIIREELQDYLDRHRPEADPLLEEIEEHAENNDVPIAAREVARLQCILARAVDADRVLEIGTAIAYTTIQVARTGRSVVSLEHDQERIRRAREYIDQAGVGDRIDVVEGDAVETLEEFGERRQYIEGFDLVFIDARKEEYHQYLDGALPLLRRNGLVTVDNLLWYGQVAEGPMDPSYEESTEALREFNHYFLNHPELEALILPVGDGTGLAIKK